MTTVAADELLGRWQAVRARVASVARDAGRDPAGITLLAVSKRHPAAAVAALAKAGQVDFGENYLQEAQAKMAELAEAALHWHFIGAIQSNKTRPIAAAFDWVHTIDRLKIAERLSAQRPDSAPPLNVCIEVNISGEPSKAGVEPAAVPGLADAIAALPRLRLRGLMALPAPSADTGVQRAAFRRVAGLAAAERARGHSMDTLSMGTTADLEAAVAEGSTLVRVGTAIFGPRPD